MFFNSLTFLVFIAIFLGCFFATRGRGRLWVCLIGSYVFYGWWDVRFLSLIVASTGIDYVVADRIERAVDPRRRKQLLIVSLISNLGMLFTFKYFNFFRDSLAELARSFGVTLDYPTLNIILPVGISFYTFQTLSYTIDVYRGRLTPERSLLKFAVFVAFFPQLVAGPIVRARDFLPQLSRDRRFNWNHVVAGSVLILCGFFKKCVVADSLAPYVDSVFAVPQLQTSATMLLGVFFYAFQIYGDFSGYSDIAIGLAKVMGYTFPVNFRRPYFADSFSDFWQRWHISLSSWLRDYLYIPLGGNRRGPRRTYINLMLTMLIGGLWHGAAWTFVVWGGLHGFYLIAQRLVSNIWSPPSNRAMRWVSGVVVFTLVCAAWIFFRATSFGNAMDVYQRIFAMDKMTIGGIQNKIIAGKGFALIAVLVGCEAMSGRVRLQARCIADPWFLMSFVILVGLAIAWLGTFGTASFIYFQF